MGELTRDALAVVGAYTFVFGAALVAYILAQHVQAKRRALKETRAAGEAHKAIARDAVENMPMRVLHPVQPLPRLQAVRRPSGDASFRDPSVQALVHTRQFELLIRGKKRGGDDEDEGGVPA